MPRNFTEKIKKKQNNKNYFFELFWKILLSKNIKRIFGLPGGAIDNLLSYKPKKIIWTNIGNELQNGFAAQSYGFFSDNVGYLFTTSGPGIATAISALGQAIYECNPLVIVTEINSKLNDGAFQNWDIKNLSLVLTKKLFYIKNKNDIFKVMKEAHDTANFYSTGVILLIENDIFIDRLYSLPKYNDKNIILYKNNSINKNIVTNSITFMNNTNILVVIGKLKVFEYKIITKFIKVNNLPFVTTWKGRFCSKEYSLNFGQIGSLGDHSANYAICNASNLLILGNVSGNLIGETKQKFSVIFTDNKDKIVSLCYNKIGALNHSEIFETNNLSHILQNLHIKINNEWLSELTFAKSKLITNLPRISKLEKFAYVASSVYDNNKLDIPISIDVGNHWYALGKYIRVNHPNTFNISSTWASIGIAIASGIGIHYATKKQIWVFMGDGGTLFSATDLMYILNNKNLPITITLYIDNEYGYIFEDYKINNYNVNDVNDVNDIINVPNIPILKNLPNCHFFSDENKYYNYLNKNPYSDKLRFIIIFLIPNKFENSLVYEINTNKVYEKNLIDKNFDAILDTKMIL